MSICKTTCPACTHRIAVVVSRDGARIRCPKCSAPLVFTGDGVRAVPLAAVAAPKTSPSSIKLHPRHDTPQVTPPADEGQRSPPRPPALRHRSTAKSGWRSRASLLPIAVAGGVAVVLLAIMATMVAFFPWASGKSGGDQPTVNRESNPDESGNPQDAAYWRKEADRLAKEAEAAKRATMELERKAAPARDRRDNAPPQAAKHDPARDPIKDALQSVAVLKLPNGHGSGFMAADRTLVTNQHVIEMGRLSDVRVGFPDNPSVRGRTFPVEILAEDPIHDLAILRVNCPVPPLTVDASYTHVNGQRIVAVGSPGTGGPGAEMIANLTTDGRLGPEYKLPNGSVLWTMAMPINAGNSGGPILDAATGKVIGVVVAKFTRTEAQSLAVPLPMLMNAIERADAARPVDIQRADSMHRARFCLAHMARLLRLAKLSFTKSCEAATSAEERTDDGMLAAFNEFKSVASRTLSDEFAAFETTVTAEVRTLRNDSACDMSTRLAVEKLHATIEVQVENLRKSVPLRQIEHFLRDFRESLARAESLAATVSKSLDVEMPEVEE
jgi:S1-C subfamily serine protease